MFVQANENLLVITKTVAYFATKFITDVKSFMLQAPETLYSAPLLFALKESNEEE